MSSISRFGAACPRNFRYFAKAQSILFPTANPFCTFEPSHQENTLMNDTLKNILDSGKRIGKQVVAFLTSPIFLKNFAGVLVASFGIIFLTDLALKFYTNHGASQEVNDLIGMDLDDARAIAKNNKLRLTIMDSIFVVGKTPNMVLSQTPKPGARVKKNRNIYLTVTKNTPDDVVLPELVGSYNFDQYKRKLTYLGIDAVVKERKIDYRQESNTILYFYLGDRKITEGELKNGIKIPMGSTLEFVVTDRRAADVSLPNLVCETYTEAEFLITSSRLKVGIVYDDGVTDRISAYVYKQEPAYAPGRKADVGNPVNLYLTDDLPTPCQ